MDHSTCTFTMLEENGYEDERPDFLSFDPAVVAEQFTLMDAVRDYSSLHSHSPVNSGLCPSVVPRPVIVLHAMEGL